MNTGRVAVKDGEVDYSGYSLRDLLQAVDAIDRARYPRNYEKIQQALAKARSGRPNPHQRAEDEASIAEITAGFVVCTLMAIAAKILIAVSPMLALHFAQGWNRAGFSSGQNCQSCAPDGK